MRVHEITNSRVLWSLWYLESIEGGANVTVYNTFIPVIVKHVPDYKPRFFHCDIKWPFVELEGYSLRKRYQNSRVL
jgi:hypothetical protein